MKLIIWILFLFTLNMVYSQESTGNYEYIGTIKIDGGQKLSYKVVFDYSNGNNITGYSITDLYGEDLTRTSIEGVYDTVKSVMSIKELGNVYTKVDASDSSFCFITAEKLKIKDVNGSKFISGDFIAKFQYGEVCATGEIFMAESSVIKKIRSIADTIKVDEKYKSIAQNTDKAFDKEQKLILMSDDELIIEYSGVDLKLEIWDGVVEDNDRISIYMNDKILIKNITLSNAKKVITLPVTDDNFKLKIVALNLGDSGINTVNFAVKDSYMVKEFTSRLYTSETFSVEFKAK